MTRYGELRKLRMKYKKYRVYVASRTGNYVVAASDTVNNLVSLVKYWMENTSAGMYLPEESSGTVVVHVLDPATGAYKVGKGASYKDKDDIITQLRKMGAR